MIFKAAKSEFMGHGPAPDAFLREMVEWAKTAPTDLFAPNPYFDIYSKVKSELGAPGADISHRKAIMLEVLRVLAGFESDWDWNEGVDTSRLGDSTPENKEAGAWQTSYDSRKLDLSLRNFLSYKCIVDGVTFQRKTKKDHPFALEYIALLLRIDVKDFHRLANGPLYKGEERDAIRLSLRAPKHSIYPHLNPAAVAEFESFLAV